MTVSRTQHTSAPALVLAMVVAASAACTASGSGDVVRKPTPDPVLEDYSDAVMDWEFRLHQFESIYEEKPSFELGDPRDAYFGELGVHQSYPPELALYESPPEWDVRVAWLGSFCSLAPRVRVFGTAEALDVIAVDTGPRVFPSAASPEDGQRDDGQNVACPAAGVMHAVDLRTSASVEDVYVVAVNDRDQLLYDWRFHPDVAVPDGTDGGPKSLAVEAPAGWDMRVAWTASKCQRRPFILVGPSVASQARHQVDVRPGPHLADEAGCDDLDVWHAIDLALVDEHEFWVRPLPDCRPAGSTYCHF